MGDIKEAEIHYDFESPPWLSGMTKKEYTPGDGMAFGLGMLDLSCSPNLDRPCLTVICILSGTHSIDQAVTLFGRPKAVTGFFRAQRGIESEVEDSFTIILQYDGPQKDLLVTVKTSVTTPMSQQLKHFIRGTKGSWLKVSPSLEFYPQERFHLLITRPVPTTKHMPSRRANLRGPQTIGAWLRRRASGGVRHSDHLQRIQ